MWTFHNVPLKGHIGQVWLYSISFLFALGHIYVRRIVNKDDIIVITKILVFKVCFA
jgi:hypothetical protein